MQKVYSVTESTLAQKFVYYKGNEICLNKVSIELNIRLLGSNIKGSMNI